MHRTVDRVWLVYVDRETQCARLMARNGLSVEEAAQRIDAQMPLEEKRAFADLVIDNRGSVQLTRNQVVAAWQQVIP